MEKNNQILYFSIFLTAFLICVLAFTEFKVFDKIDVSQLDDTLNVDEFYKMGHEPNVEILDVRAPDEYEYGHVGGVLNINFHDTLNFKNEIENLDRNKTYLIYCRTDRRSGKTLEMMEESGFKNVHLLKGGILAWKLAGKSVIKEPVQ